MNNAYTPARRGNAAFVDLVSGKWLMALWAGGSIFRAWSGIPTIRCRVAVLRRPLDRSHLHSPVCISAATRENQ